jgi:uncharacterized membrane protein YqgA involved in biofilm formation
VFLLFLLGTIVNATAILLGSVVGLVLPKMSERIKSTVMQGLSLAVILIGIGMALGDQADILIIIISMVIGGLIGEWINIESALMRFGQWIEKYAHRFNDGMVAEAFVTSSLVFCVGSMAIVGAVQSGTEGTNSTLYAKSLLDMFSSLVFASTLGFGVALAAIPVFLYEGAIALISHFAGTILQNAGLIASMSATGGLLIVGIGINLLGLKKLTVGNLLPAMFVAPALKWLSPSMMQLIHHLSS